MRSIAVTLALTAALLAPNAQALNILLTNDDGFETANIQALFQALRKAGHDVVMAAPYSGQSGSGGRIAFLRPIGPTADRSPGGTIKAGAPGVGETRIAPGQHYVDGTPAAALLYGLDVLAAKRWGKAPDLVISGPNEGNNLGLVTPHSGTLGAAVTALNKGVPAIAVSAESEDAQAAEVVAALVLRLLVALDSDDGISLPQGIGLNVNLPAIEADANAANFAFALTRVGRAANIGLQFSQNIGAHPMAKVFGIPEQVSLPAVAIAVPAESAGYQRDTDPLSEGRALAPEVVTVSPIEGTYAADQRLEAEVRSSLGELIAP